MSTDLRDALFGGKQRRVACAAVKLTKDTEIEALECLSERPRDVIESMLMLKARWMNELVQNNPAFLEKALELDDRLLMLKFIYDYLGVLKFHLVISRLDEISFVSPEEKRLYGMIVGRCCDEEAFRKRINVPVFSSVHISIIEGAVVAKHSWLYEGSDNVALIVELFDMLRRLSFKPNATSLQVVIFECLLGVLRLIFALKLHSKELLDAVIEVVQENWHNSVIAIRYKVKAMLELLLNDEEMQAIAEEKVKELLERTSVDDRFRYDLLCMLVNIKFQVPQETLREAFRRLANPLLTSPIANLLAKSFSQEVDLDVFKDAFLECLTSDNETLRINSCVYFLEHLIKGKQKDAKYRIKLREFVQDVISLLVAKKTVPGLIRMLKSCKKFSFSVCIDLECQELLENSLHHHDELVQLDVFEWVAESETDYLKLSVLLKDVLGSLLVRTTPTAQMRFQILMKRLVEKLTLEQKQIVFDQVLYFIRLDSSFQRIQATVNILGNLVDLETSLLNRFTSEKVSVLVHLLEDSFPFLRLQAFKLLLKVPLTTILRAEEAAFWKNFAVDLSQKRFHPTTNEFSSYLSHILLHFGFLDTTEEEELAAILDKWRKYLDNQNVLTKVCSHGSAWIGTMFRLRLLLEYGSCSKAVELESTITLIQRTCTRVIEIVSVQSPEGLNILAILKDTGDTEFSGDPTSSNHYLMTFCWRTIKEACLLFEALVRTTRSRIEKAHLVSIGEYLRYLFHSARHLGAFHAVEPAFLFVCKCLMEFPGDNTVLKWLKEDLDTFSEKQSILVTTRRSGGIPICISTALRAELQQRAAGKVSYLALKNELLKEQNDLEWDGSRPFMSLAMNCLITCSLSEDEESAVHALNCLLFLLRDGDFSESIEPWLDSCFTCIARGSDHKDWRVRNSATLVFSAWIARVIQRQNSSSFNQLMRKYPQVEQYLLNKLSSEDLSIAPLLLLFQSFRITREDETSQNCLGWLLRLTGCKFARVRLFAARAYVKLLHSIDEKSIDDLLAVKLGSFNEIHGWLEIAKLMKVSVDRVFEKLSWIFSTDYDTAGSKFLRACIVEFLALGELSDQCLTQIDVFYNDYDFTLIYEAEAYAKICAEPQKLLGRVRSNFVVTATILKLAEPDKVSYEFILDSMNCDDVLVLEGAVSLLTKKTISNIQESSLLDYILNKLKRPISPKRVELLLPLAGRLASKQHLVSITNLVGKYSDELEPTIVRASAYICLVSCFKKLSPSEISGFGLKLLVQALYDDDVDIRCDMSKFLYHWMPGRRPADERLVELLSAHAEYGELEFELKQRVLAANRPIERAALLFDPEKPNLYREDYILLRAFNGKLREEIVFDNQQ